MSYNGSGTFSLSATLSPNSLASASSVNSILSNIATYGLSLALVRDGQSSMTGQFKAYAGLIGTPGISFATETTSGLYRKSSGVIGIVIGGTEIGTWSASTGCTAGLIGELKAWAGTGSQPEGWLTCDGSAVSRTTYAALYAVIGTTYGVGDGSTTFNLPDARGRTIVGTDNMGGSAANRLDWANTMGATGGAQFPSLASGGSIAGSGSNKLDVSQPGIAVRWLIRY